MFVSKRNKLRQSDVRFRMSDNTAITFMANRVLLLLPT